MLSHNAALNAVFDEAMARNFLTDLNRPKLEAIGKKSERRPSFTLNELRALLSNFEAWIGRGWCLCLSKPCDIATIFSYGKRRR